MRRWIPYPFVRLTGYLSLGILAYVFYDTDIGLILPLLLVAILVYGICYFLSNKKRFYFYAFPLGFCAFIILFLSGYFRTYQVVEKNNPQHIAHLSHKVSFYEGKVLRPLEENAKTMSVDIMVRKVNINGNWHDAFGKVKLYINKHEDVPKLFYGDLLLVRGFAHPLKEKLNPGTFDYKTYLEYQQIYFTDYIYKDDLILYGNKGRSSIIGYAFQIQMACANIVKTYVDNPSAQSIIMALVLGTKSDIDNALKEAYAAAGVMHVLAVSGLHVGIIYSILLFSLGWLKKKKWLFAFLCLLILWLFAFVTGLSPSVLRAVTMFSFIIVAKASNKQTNIYNTIFASAFFLLLLNPFFILTVGFQLSYLAVLGIVFLYPKIYPIFSFNNTLADRVWSLMCVSLAAQLAVFPLSTYYFNQFPLYFLLANIVLVPSAFLILSLGIGLLVVSFFAPLATIVGYILDFLVTSINYFVVWISDLPLSRFSGLYISAGQTAILMAFLLCVFGLFYYKKFVWVIVVAGLLFGFQLITLKRQWNRHNDKQIVYYSINQSGVLGFSVGDYYQLISTGGRPLNEQTFNYTVNPDFMRRGYNIAYENILGTNPKGEIQKASLSYGTILVWNGYKVLILDNIIKHNEHFEKKIKVDVVILEKDAIKSLDEIPKSLVFDKLIVGNTYKYNVAARLIKEAQASDVEVVHPLTTGASIVNLND